MDRKTSVLQEMNYQLRVRSDLRVSDLCLGTMTMGDDRGWGSPKDEAKKIYDALREAGGDPIIGARKLAQFEDNLKSLEIAFSPEQVRRLDDVSAVPMGFPNDLLAGVVRGSLFGGMRDRIRA